MLKTIRKAYDGLEDVYELLLEKKASIDSRKEEAKKLALAKVDADFEEESKHIDNAIINATYELEVEVPDVVDEQVETTEELLQEIAQ